jgi:hypothetical protein
MGHSVYMLHPISLVALYFVQKKGYIRQLHVSSSKTKKKCLLHVLPPSSVRITTPLAYHLSKGP